MLNFVNLMLRKIHFYSVNIRRGIFTEYLVYEVDNMLFVCALNYKYF